MKIAYISPAFDGTGYANAAIEYMRALKAAGADVVSRHVKMTPTNGEVHPDIKEMEKKDTDNVDAVIQHNLPSTFGYKAGVKNIGAFAYETDRFPGAIWNQNLNIMNGIVVFAKSQIDALKNEGIEVKSTVIPHPVDVERYNSIYPYVDFNVPENCIKFYTVSELTKRKALDKLIQAYYLAFTREDNVLLVVKTHLPNRNSSATLQFFAQMCEEIKSGMKLYADKSHYPTISLVHDYLPNEQLYGLHQSCDVFVSASYGESCCLPAIDAMGFGNVVIAGNHTAFADYIVHNENGYLVEAQACPVYGATDSIHNLYTSNEHWFSVNVELLAKQMKKVAKEQDNLADIRTRARQDVITKYNHETIGKQMMEFIQGV